MSEQLVRLVQVVFGVVVAQSLVLYKDVVTRPDRFPLAAVALVIVLYCVIRSWIDWHGAMVNNPYVTRAMSRPGLSSETVRLYADIVIVGVYAYLLFTVGLLISSDGQPLNAANIMAHVLGYPIVYFWYLISGLTRVRMHGSKASDWALILVFFVWLCAVAVTYGLLFRATGTDSSRLVLNCVGLGVVFLSILAYREVRLWRKRRRLKGNEK